MDGSPKLGMNPYDADMTETALQLPHPGDLVVLVAIADTGGVGAAARSLGLAQPNASRALARLERQLRVRLVERTARGSALTSAGDAVADWAREVLDANRRLLAGTRALATERAQLSIAASQTIAEELLPRWLAAFREKHPEVDVSLVIANSFEVGRLVSAEGCLGFIESPDLPGSLRVPVTQRTLATDRLVVVVEPHHEWARRTRPISTEELAATPLVVREQGSGTRVSLEDALAGLPLARPALELGSNSAVRASVVSGAGPAVLSELAVEEAVASGQLQAVMVADLVIERRLRAVWTTRPGLSGAGAQLVELAATLGGRDRAAGDASPRPVRGRTVSRS
jgi:DNA-binding transcriptional LysR family regulator